jgi:hypothetical protein
LINPRAAQQQYPDQQRQNLATKPKVAKKLRAAHLLKLARKGMYPLLFGEKQSATNREQQQESLKLYSCT